MNGKTSYNIFVFLQNFNYFWRNTIVEAHFITYFRTVNTPKGKISYKKKSNGDRKTHWFKLLLALVG